MKEKIPFPSYVSHLCAHSQTPDPTSQWQTNLESSAFPVQPAFFLSSSELPDLKHGPPLFAIFSEVMT